MGSFFYSGGAFYDDSRCPACHTSPCLEDCPVYIAELLLLAEVRDGERRCVCLGCGVVAVGRPLQDSDHLEVCHSLRTGIVRSLSPPRPQSDGFDLTIS